MTGSPISNSNTNPITPGAVRIETQAVINGFKVAADGLSAARDYTVDGKNLTITMFFPANTSKTEREKRLNQFSQAKLDSSARTAIALGVGTKQVSVKFTQDAQGKVTTERIKNGTAKTIEDYFRDKTTKAEKPENAANKDAKIAAITKQKQAVESMKAIWQGRIPQSTASQTQRPSNRTQPERREDTNSTDKQGESKITREPIRRNPFKKQKVDLPENQPKKTSSVNNRVEEDISEMSDDEESELSDLVEDDE